MELKAVDKVEINIIMDNVADWILEDTEFVQRAQDSKDSKELKVPLMAEHSLCLLISIYRGNTKHDILLDAAENGISLDNNLNIMDLKLNQVQELIISHAHSDHTHGLPYVISKLNADAKVIAHPDVFLTGRTCVDRGQTIVNDCPSRDLILDHGNTIVESRKPYLSDDEMFLVTGEIPRKTSFEKLEYESYVVRDGVREFDNILDDQAIVINIRDEGLLVISGCAHSGIINTVRYAQELTKISKVYSVIGGFHLPPKIKCDVTEKTIVAFKEINPKLIVPMHCTGIYAISRFIQEFGIQCNLSCVGSKFTF